MIELIGKPGDGAGKIRFSPRAGFKRTQPTLEKELVYGYRCEKCHNVVLALMLTDKPVNLWYYEETNVISLAEKKFGEINRILPNETSLKDFSCYESLMFDQGKQKGQRLRLKKHILTMLPIEHQFAQDKIFETGGEHCCEDTGWFSRREDLLIKDILLANNMVITTIAAYDLSKMGVGSFVGSINNSSFRALTGIGNVPPLVLINRVSFADGRRLGECVNIVQSCQKGKDVSV